MYKLNGKFYQKYEAWVFANANDQYVLTAPGKLTMDGQQRVKNTWEDLGVTQSGDYMLHVAHYDQSGTSYVFSWPEIVKAVPQFSIMEEGNRPITTNVDSLLCPRFNKLYETVHSAGNRRGDFPLGQYDNFDLVRDYAETYYYMARAKDNGRKDLEETARDILIRFQDVLHPCIIRDVDASMANAMKYLRNHEQIKTAATFDL